MNSSLTPSRIVCLSAEAAEVLRRLGCLERVVGITAFANEACKAAGIPVVSGFSSVNFDRIEQLKPELVITFSDVQADAARELIRRGHPVLATNQRSLAEIFETILLIGRVVGRSAEALKLVEEMRREIFEPQPDGNMQARPKVYFEEWDEPMISGICWVSELIEAAGGKDIFGEFRVRGRAPERVVTSEEIIRRQPDIIILSWCGKKADRPFVCRRLGWEAVPAVREDRVYEIPSEDILQPGPGLLAGFRQLHQIIADCTLKMAGVQ